MKKIYILLVSTLVAVTPVMGMNDDSLNKQSARLTLSQTETTKKLSKQDAFLLQNGSESFRKQHHYNDPYTSNPVTADTRTKWQDLCEKHLTSRSTSKEDLPTLNVNLQLKSPAVEISSFPCTIFYDHSLRNILEHHQEANIGLFHDGKQLAILTVTANSGHFSSHPENDPDKQPGQERNDVITQVTTSSDQPARDNFYTITSITVPNENGICRLHLVPFKGSNNSSNTTIFIKKKKLDALADSNDRFAGKSDGTIMFSMEHLRSKLLAMKLQMSGPDTPRLPDQKNSSSSSTTPTTSMVITNLEPTNLEGETESLYTIADIEYKSEIGIYELHLTPPATTNNSSLTTLYISKENCEKLIDSKSYFVCTSDDTIMFDFNDFKKKIDRLIQTKPDSLLGHPREGDNNSISSISTTSISPTTSLRTKIYFLMGVVSLVLIGRIIVFYITEKNGYYHNNSPVTKFIDGLVNSLLAFVYKGKFC
jgi:hypothetical protein